ncbi:MAG: GGDEF domain-containing protein [Prosthecochloris sp.]|nr:GGDEF domain-containing protein [Prosthecochloris sp.]
MPSLRPFIVAGIVALVVLLSGATVFVFHQQKLHQHAGAVQVLYKDLLEFRSTLSAINRKILTNENRQEVLDSVVQDTRFLHLRSVAWQSKAEESHMPGLAEWLRSQQLMLNRWLDGMNNDAYPDPDSTITMMLLQLDDVILETSMELQHSHERISSSIQFFLFIVLFVLLMFAVSATGIITVNYRKTVLPLNRLAGRLRSCNKDLPESIHDTVEDVRRHYSHDTFSHDIHQISHSIVTFCQDLEQKNKKLDELFIRDEKTNLYNYRHFRDHLVMDVARARRYNDPISLAMIDIDHFKIYNDNNGHVAGDRVLCRMAEIFIHECRKEDVPARFGGEEFAILFPRTDAGQAHMIVERLRFVISREPFEFKEGQPGGDLTISAGVATFPEDASDWFSLVNHADRALYYAKSMGKNRVMSYSDIQLEGP